MIRIVLTDMENFSFVIPEVLAGSARPGTFDQLDNDLAIMREHGIGVLVTLTEAPLDSSAITTASMEYHHIPVVDFMPPSHAQFREFIGIVDSAKKDSKGSVLVHCAAGVGRTGSMIAAYLVSQGMSAEEAIRETRRSRPGSLETNGQVQAIYAWEKAFSQA